jgi:hypothetical protein
MWKEWPKQIDLLNFRSESYYVGQFASRWRYLITAAYLDTVDDRGLLYNLPEDGQFGAITLKVLDQVVISRDLLDSILEINFLRHSLRLDPGERYVDLDIGAAYGRFAHRFTAVFPGSYVYCVGAVPLSTFLCDFYIRFREFSDQAETVPLFEVDRLAGKQIDFATNIHNWSECTLSAITYWLDLCADFRVPFLFVVPHEASFLRMEPFGSRQSFLPEIMYHGYKAIVQGNKFGGSKFMQKYGICDAPYFLFELRR